MNKKNNFISVSTILSLLLCLLAAIVVWLFAKYNNLPDAPAASAALFESFRLIV